MLAVPPPPYRMKLMNSRKNQLLVVGAVFALALSLRLYQLLWGVPLTHVVWSDMQGYVQIAEMVRNGVWQVNHFFQSIGFPMLIKIVRDAFEEWGFALSLIQCVASMFTLFFMWKATEESFGFKAGLITLIIGAIHWPWILLTTYALPETLFACLLSICAWMSVRVFKSERCSWTYALVWGLSFTAALWLKGTHAFWGPMFLVGVLWIKRVKGLVPVVALGIPVAVGIILHGVFTYQKIGKVQLSASASGINFIEGKCPSKKNRDNAGYGWHSPLYYQLGINDEKQWDMPFTESSYYWGAGFDCIKSDPFALIQAFEGITYLFYGNTTWPINQIQSKHKLRLYELYFSLFLVVGMVVFFLDLGRNFSLERFVVWTTPVLAIFLCVYVFKSEMRFRIPFDVWFIPLSVVGWTSLLKRPRHEATQG